MSTKKRTDRTRFMVQLALLIAIQIVLTATPLGFIQLGPVHLTIIHIPVLIGAIAMGPKTGAILGSVFGISSIITATIKGTLDSYVFSPIHSKNLWSIVIAMAPRILFGLLTGWLFLALRKTKMPIGVSAGISAGIGALLHTVLVLGSIYLFMGRIYADKMGLAYDALLGAMALVVVNNGVFEMISAILVCAPLAKPLMIAQHKTTA